MKILTKDRCKDCDGVGLITNSEWQRLYEYEKDNPEKVDENWDDFVRGWFLLSGYNTVPSEECQCSECEGTGEIEQWMNVNEVLEKANLIG